MKTKRKEPDCELMDCVFGAYICRGGYESKNCPNKKPVGFVYKSEYYFFCGRGEEKKNE